MPIFFVGIEIERTVMSDLIVRVEADTESAANEKAKAAARKACRENAGPDGVFSDPTDVDWEEAGMGVNGISDTPYSDAYAPDIDLVEPPL